MTSGESLEKVIYERKRDMYFRCKTCRHYEKDIGWQYGGFCSAEPNTVANLGSCLNEHNDEYYGYVPDEENIVCTAKEIGISVSDLIRLLEFTKPKKP